MLNFDAFQEKVFWDAVKKSPETMSRLRVFEAEGITKHNALLDDLSVARSREDLAQAKTTLATLLNYADDELSTEQQLNKELMVYSLREQVRNGRFLFHNYPVTQLYGWHNGLAGFLTGTHSITDAQDAHYYIARLNAVRAQFTQLMGQLRDREELGIIPPTFIIDKALFQLNNFVKSDPRQNALYVVFEAKLNAVETIGLDEKIEFLVAAERAIYTEIYPIWAELQSYLGKLKAKSTDDAGVWKLPDGKAYYQSQLELYTTTKMTADEIHILGLAEVARIQSQMLALFEAEGYDTSGDFVKLINGFAQEDRHFYPDTDEGRAQIITDYTALIEEIAAGISSQFNLTVKVPVEVARVPVFLEQSAPVGYYEDPAVDGSRPGRFYTNLYDIRATPKYGMRALTYHEAVPGHHYQIAIQQGQKGLPWFRKYANYTAYVEGWALYSERVALEMGFQPTNLDKIGALQSEMFRAVRLVVDTGIHDKRWTREHAIKYMADNTGMAISDVTSEIERYIVWPGQATAYKIGQLTLLRLRDEVSEALGNKFDIRAFHDLILRGGAVPLTVLEGVVQDFVVREKA
ncbi:MAG: DUF885 domain-containing protein [Kordiimonadales bacterium]|nr:MAG: DUF885 domain-containing protein [Kordiimonadales bacterium]